MKKPPGETNFFFGPCPLLQDEYERVKNAYIITPAIMAKAKSKMILMHPLPRVNEIRYGLWCKGILQIETAVFIRFDAYL